MSKVNGHSVDAGAVAVHGLPDGSCGRLVFWKLDGNVDERALEQAWAAAGLNPKLRPRAPSPKQALRRALGELEGKRRLVRPLDGGGYAVVDERDGGGALEYSTRFHVNLDAAGRPATSNAFPGAGGDDALLRAVHESMLHTLAPVDVSSWLCDMAAHHDGVALRDGGGIYFIPARQVASWNLVVGALRSVSAHKVYAVPALRSDQAVEAIMDALADEVGAAVEAIQRDLDGGDLGERAKQTRLGRAAELERKLGEFERLFDRRQEGLHQQLEQLRGHIALVQLARLDGGQLGLAVES